MNRIKQPERYGRTCMNCAWKHHPQMLTTYCLKGTTCSYCGRVTETAIVDFDPPKKTTEPPSANRILHAKVSKLEKRLGKRVWDGVFFDRDCVSDPSMLILNNKIGKEIREVLRLEEIENCSHAPCVCGQVTCFLK